jgi:hypothetical protein
VPLNSANVIYEPTAVVPCCMALDAAVGVTNADVTSYPLNPIESCGTMIYQKEDDSEPIIVENAYNRLVLYNGKLLHSAIGGGFGKRCEDCRLTIVFFTYMTSVNMPVIS